MSNIQLGLICCLSFVTLEAFQAVYLGTVFQDVDSFLVGTWVFGISVVGCTLATAIYRPAELAASGHAWRILVAVNLFAALTWTTYFIAVQLIEPAVVFTIFSGMVPLGTVIAAWLGLPEAWLPLTPARLSREKRLAAMPPLSRKLQPEMVIPAPVPAREMASNAPSQITVLVRLT
ncbi:MAG: hypothetical protein L3J13_02960, partial [Devosiaceae bacterium]|nr:hypothetical protein [Devosiaceae bacterium]